MNKIGAVRAYLLLTFFSSLLFALMATYAGVYRVTVVGLNPLQLVLVGTVLELSAFLAEVPTGIVADVYSRRLSILIGVALTGLGFAVEGMFPTLAAALVAQVIWGVGATFGSGATSAWITDEVGEANVGPLFMRASQMGQIGGILGVILGLGFALVAINLPIIVGGLAHLVLAGYLAFVMPETGFKPTPREDRNTFQHMAYTFKEGIKVMRVRPVLILLLATSVFWGMSSEGYDRLWQKHLIDNLTFPTLGNFEPVVWFGILSLVGSAVSIVGTEVVRRRVNMNRAQSLERGLTIITALLIGSVMAFALAGNFVMAFLAILAVDLFRSIRWPLYDTWMNQHIESRVRATVLSMSAQLDAFGQIAGGPVVGFIGLRVTVRVAIFTAAVLLSPALLLFRRTRRHDPVIGKPAAVVE